METPLLTLHLLEMMIFIMASLVMVNLIIGSKADVRLARM